jgi:hypothetical protein
MDHRTELWLTLGLLAVSGGIFAAARHRFERPPEFDTRLFRVPWLAIMMVSALFFLGGLAHLTALMTGVPVPGSFNRY